MGARGRIGIGLSYWPAGHIGWRNRSLEPIPGLLIRLQFRAMYSVLAAKEKLKYGLAISLSYPIGEEGGIILLQMIFTSLRYDKVRWGGGGGQYTVNKTQYLLE